MYLTELSYLAWIRRYSMLTQPSEHTILVSELCYLTDRNEIST